MVPNTERAFSCRQTPSETSRGQRGWSASDTPGAELFVPDQTEAGPSSQSPEARTPGSLVRRAVSFFPGLAPVPMGGGCGVPQPGAQASQLPVCERRGRPGRSPSL